jgi:sugar phosphate isomerase/epimerase
VGLLLLAAATQGKAEAAPSVPKIYAFCVEAGVPGLTPRGAADLAGLLRELGFDGVGHSFLTDPRLEETLRTFDKAGLEVYILQAPVNLDPKAPSPFDAGVPAAIRKLKGRPATVVVNLYGLKPGDPAGMQPAVRWLRQLGSVAAEAGVRVSVYNHVDCWSESVAFCVEVVKKVDRPQVGFNFNLCHWLKVEGNRDYRPLLRANAGKLFCVTICGAQVGAQTWTNGLIQPLDRGDFDNRALLATLREIGYQGPVGIMCYGIPGDAREYLQRSMKTWKSWTARP